MKEKTSSRNYEQNQDSPLKKGNDPIVVGGYIMKPLSDIELTKRETDMKARVFYYNHFNRK